jgi:hypothetical protein
MNYSKTPINEYAAGKNTKLYEFLATNYDISDLAKKIHAEKYAKLNILSLRKNSASLA